MRKRIGIWAIQLPVLLALVAGVYIYTAATKVVVLEVDGQTIEVRTTASTVGDVLNAEDVQLREEDLISVSADTPLEDGHEIVVHYAKPVTVHIDGEEHEDIVHDTSVADVLDRFDVEVVEGLYVSHDLDDAIDRDGAEIVVSTPKSVTVIADGIERHITTISPTVESILDDFSIVLGDDDEVSIDLDQPLSPGDVVRVVRIEFVERTETVSVAFSTDVEDDSDAYVGQVEVIRNGVNGEAEEDVRVTVADGEERDREVLERRVITEPVSQQERRGTKQRPVPDVGDTSVWDRLAQCESGGNWSINTGNGYYGGLQFHPNTWRSVGGSGLPHEASREEQIHRGQILQQRAGWGQWPSCSSRLGLR